jgi:hypothetical protein
VYGHKTTTGWQFVTLDSANLIVPTLRFSEAGVASISYQAGYSVRFAAPDFSGAWKVSTLFARTTASLFGIRHTWANGVPIVTFVYLDSTSSPYTSTVYAATPSTSGTWTLGSFEQMTQCSVYMTGPAYNPYVDTRGYGLVGVSYGPKCAGDLKFAEGSPVF